VHADADPDGEPGTTQFFDDLEVHLVRLLGSAELFWIRQAEQAHPAECREHVARELSVAFSGGCPRSECVAREVGDQVEEVDGLRSRQCPLDLHTSM
jgi:hypothetical protein